MHRDKALIGRNDGGTVSGTLDEDDPHGLPLDLITHVPDLEEEELHDRDDQKEDVHANVSVSHGERASLVGVLGLLRQELVCDLCEVKRQMSSGASEKARSAA